MFKSEKKCHGEGCDSHYIQNKKYHLCSDCVFKKNHGGESRQDVMMRKMNTKQQESMLSKAMSQASMKSLSKILISEEEQMFENNKINQDNVKEVDQEEEDKFFLKEALIAEPIVGYYSNNSKRLLRTGDNKLGRRPKIKKYIKKTKKQSDIDRLYKATCIDMDYTHEPVCSGCGRYQGGDIRLSHSHIISRKDCKEIGKSELIYTIDNLRYHCLDYGENTGCHRKWENPKERYKLCDYNSNIEYIKKAAPELLQKYMFK